MPSIEKSVVERLRRPRPARRRSRDGSSSTAASTRAAAKSGPSSAGHAEGEEHEAVGSIGRELDALGDDRRRSGTRASAGKSLRGSPPNRRSTGGERRPPDRRRPRSPGSHCSARTTCRGTGRSIAPVVRSKEARVPRASCSYGVPLKTAARSLRVGDVLAGWTGPGRPPARSRRARAAQRSVAGEDASHARSPRCGAATSSSSAGTVK